MNMLQVYNLCFENYHLKITKYPYAKRVAIASTNMCQRCINQLTPLANKFNLGAINL